MVFAVPNVIGAVFMGAVLQRPGASEALVRRHGVACWLFSLVTLAFQIFFLFWLVLGLEESVQKVFLLPLLLVVLLIGHGDRGSPWTRFASVLLLYVSFAAAVWWLRSGPIIGVLPEPRLSSKELIWLAPVCALGFGLCPYLDLTFHTARQKLPGVPGTAAFALGFGVMFLAMIMLTLLYAGPLLDHARSLELDVQPGLLPRSLVVHVTVQLAFTIMLHKAWVERQPSPAGPKAPANGGILALVIGVAAAIGAYRLPDIAGLSGPEVVYRGFMSFYGLVFPAYVWICVIGSKSPRPTHQQLAAFAAAVALAAPMYWMGFIQGVTWWLGPGVLVVLLARLFAKEPQMTAE